ncbi:MAG: hypothetical protein GXP08_06730 [Gammaproteobacteria bacterium]|nr:hypothetical protein [Gammaproteobacteria bacterium]
MPIKRRGWRSWQRRVVVYILCVINASKPRCYCVFLLKMVFYVRLATNLSDKGEIKNENDSENQSDP